MVSVVIPVHNGQKYIKESIDSCLNQTYKSIEIVVVDDESTDNTLDILKEYGEKIKIVSVKKQNGLGNVINLGIKESTGEYIARLDADDIMYPTRLEKQMQYLDNNPKCVVVGGQVDVIDENGNIVNHREYAVEDKDIRKNLFLFSPFAHPAVTIRRLSLESVGLYPEDIWKVEDVKLFFLLSKGGEFHNIPDTVIKYRMTFNTQSQSNMVEHFKKTNAIREWAIRELDIKPSFREITIWNIQKFGVYILSILPPRMFMKVFEYTRKILK